MDLLTVFGDLLWGIYFDDLKLKETVEVPIVLEARHPGPGIVS